MNKKISFVKQFNDKVQVYDIKGNYMFTRYGKLDSYTPDSVNMKTADKRTVVYDSAGTYKYCR